MDESLSVPGNVEVDWLAVSEAPLLPDVALVPVRKLLLDAAELVSELPVELELPLEEEPEALDVELAEFSDFVPEELLESVRWHGLARISKTS